MLHLELREAGSGAPIYITAFLPGRPASVLCGIASGATLMGADPQPSATRIVLVRVPAATAGELHRSDRYLPLEPAALGADLLALGIVPTDPGAAAAELRSFLAEGSRSGLSQASQEAQARLARLFDSMAEAHRPETAGVTGASTMPGVWSDPGNASAPSRVGVMRGCPWATGAANSGRPSMPRPGARAGAGHRARPRSACFVTAAGECQG